MSFLSARQNAPAIHSDAYPCGRNTSPRVDRGANPRLGGAARARASRRTRSAAAFVESTPVLPACSGASDDCPARKSGNPDLGERLRARVHFLQKSGNDFRCGSVGEPLGDHRGRFGRRRRTGTGQRAGRGHLDAQTGDRDARSSRTISHATSTTNVTIGRPAAADCTSTNARRRECHRHLTSTSNEACEHMGWNAPLDLEARCRE